MAKLLSDARIVAILSFAEGDGWEKSKEVAEAEHEATLKAVGEWLEGDCPHHVIADDEGDISYRVRRECMTCLTALKEGRMP